jgi:hypothetical protein
MSQFWPESSEAQSGLTFFLCSEGIGLYSVVILSDLGAWDMADLSKMDMDEIATWLSRKAVRVDSLRLRVPDDEVVLEYNGGRLTVKQAGGVAGEFTGTVALKLMQVAVGRAAG